MTLSLISILSKQDVTNYRSLAVAFERFFATYYVDTYETKKRKWISILVCSELTVACGVSAIIMLFGTWKPLKKFPGNLNFQICFQFQSWRFLEFLSAVRRFL